jgi:hypothetical protein
VVVGRERLRQLLRAHEITWQRTRTWKDSTDLDFDTKLDRIEEVTSKVGHRLVDPLDGGTNKIFWDSSLPDVEARGGGFYLGVEAPRIGART